VSLETPTHTQIILLLRVTSCLALRPRFSCPCVVTDTLCCSIMPCVYQLPLAQEPPLGRSCTTSVPSPLCGGLPQHSAWAPPTRGGSPISLSSCSDCMPSAWGPAIGNRDSPGRSRRARAAARVRGPQLWWVASQHTTLPHLARACPGTAPATPSDPLAAHIGPCHSTARWLT